MVAFIAAITGFIIGTTIFMVMDIRSSVTKTVNDDGSVTYEGSAHIPKWLGKRIDGKKFHSTNVVLNKIVRKVFFS